MMLQSKLHLYYHSVTNGNDETIIKYRNIIGRDELRTFFAKHGNPLMDSQIESISEINKGDCKRFVYPNKTDYIEVTGI